MNEKIDVVITWVDGNDPEWLKERRLYEKEINGNDDSGTDEVRFRDWDNLQYIFRGIEK
ncbi:MAG: Stealth CR1 domain-containing protein, partial [Lachnospiraceae bacterium]|nr:Stealth CR1 domain-containing protein [Lachnospiraceae bacterium]